jgi:hypothetical protein
METLASRIEHQLQGGTWDYNVPHAAVYEQELKLFWALNEEHRAAKIAQFAKEHGFRVRFYSKRLYATFNEGCRSDMRLQVISSRCAKFYSPSPDAVIRVYDDTGSVIETPELSRQDCVRNCQQKHSGAGVTAINCFWR